MKILKHLIRILVKYEDPINQIYLHLTASKADRNYNRKHLNNSPKVRLYYSMKTGIIFSTKNTWNLYND